jgi:hypothetical protein
MRHFALAALLFTTIPVSATVAANNSGDMVIYEVRRGDTLVDLSKKYLIRPSDYRIVQRTNQVGNPLLLPVGQKLRINRDLLKYQPSTARIVSVRGNVEIVRSGSAILATNGQSLGEGAGLRTAGSSFVTLQLDDGSRISLPSNSDVTIARLRKYILGSSIDYDFNVARGGLNSKVAKTKSANDRYQVRTPKAVSAVRGTEFQSRISETSGSDFAEVVEGGLDVGLVSGNRMAVAAETGLSVAQNGAVTTETLMPAPDVANAGKLQMRPKVRFDFGGGSANAMRVLLASDAGFVDTIGDLTGTAGIVEFENIEDGNYFARFRSISPNGFEGLPQTYAFKRRLNNVSGSAGKGDSGYSFKWSSEGKGTIRNHFQLHRGSIQSLPMVDETGLAVNQIILSDLLPGDYYWRVASIQYMDGEVSENWTDFEKLTVSAP